MQINSNFKEFEIFLWKKGRFRLRWDLSLGLLIASRLILASNHSARESVFFSTERFHIFKNLKLLNLYNFDQ